MASTRMDVVGSAAFITVRARCFQYCDPVVAPPKLDIMAIDQLHSPVMGGAIVGTVKLDAIFDVTFFTNDEGAISIMAGSRRPAGTTLLPTEAPGIITG